jgi:hypothetical protein
MSMYLRLRRFVDRDLGHHLSYTQSATLSVWAVVVPLAPFVLLKSPYNAAELAIAALSITASVSWVAFLLWRCLRLLRAAGARGDRDFDRRSKHMLGPEYRSTESFTAARSRRKRVEGS